MRKIDADELEELFREVIGGIARRPELNGAMEHMIRASAMVIEMINDMPTIEDTNEKVAWKPMTEKPTKEDFYMITYHHYARNEEIVDVDYLDDLGEFWDEHKDTVTAWAELPEPYRKAQNGKSDLC